MTVFFNVIGQLHIPGTAGGVLDCPQFFTRASRNAAPLEDVRRDKHRPQRCRPAFRLTPGAIFAATASVAVSFVFSWYLQTFVRTAAYGPLAAMMGFLLWTWLSVQIIILGAELNAEIEHQTAIDTTTGAPVAIGARVQLFGLDADIGASGTVSRGDGDNASVFLSLSGAF